jgi:hypothetical protein
VHVASCPAIRLAWLLAGRLSARAVLPSWIAHFVCGKLHLSGHSKPRSSGAWGWGVGMSPIPSRCPSTCGWRVTRCGVSPHAEPQGRRDDMPPRARRTPPPAAWSAHLAVARSRMRDLWPCPYRLIRQVLAHTSHSAPPLDDAPPIFPGACCARTVEANHGRLSSHARRTSNACAPGEW